MLSPFVENEKLKEIFGHDLLDDENMLKYFDGLVSEQFDKPFECIGTREEINAALSKTLEKRTGHLPLLLEKYKEKYLSLIHISRLCPRPRKGVPRRLCSSLA